MARPLTVATRLIHAYLDDVGALHVAGSAALADVEAHLERRYAFDEPRSPDDVLGDLASLLRRGVVQATSGAYFGFFHPSVPEEAVAAAALAAAVDPQLATVSHGRAAYAIERHVLAFLARAIGYDPARCAAHFTSGGQESNTEAVVVALTRAFPEVRDGGVRAVPGAPTLYASAEAHHSLEKAAHAAGLGRGSVRRVPVDAELRMDVAALAARLADDRRSGHIPFLVAGTAGTTATGAIDPLPALADLCAREGLWFHCDAAWGGGALLSRTLRAHLDGIARADSVTWDAHKWLQAPLGAGMLFTRHPGALRAAFATESPYMPPRRSGPEGDAAGRDDLYDVSLQWSRRAAGLPLFAWMATVGADGVAEVIDRCAALGRTLAVRLAEAGFSLATRSPLPVVGFTHPWIEDGPLRPGEVARAVDRAGAAWIAPVRLSDGRTVLRACVNSHRTTEADVDRLVSALRDALDRLGRRREPRPTSA
jgi:glutamate/tyrosine decarboxylase-like PLP-dependent enzyme